jgi:hypothetical protein
MSVAGDFAALNLYVYHRVCGVFLDVVIWCLGPFVDDTRTYGPARCCLALITRGVCRAWLGRPVRS